MAGVPLKAVADLLGHSETRITETYAHLAPAPLQSYVNVLDGMPMMMGVRTVEAGSGTT